MEFNIKAIFTLETKDDGTIGLCFKHAVQAANKGKDVKLEVGDCFSDVCRICYKKKHRIK